MQGGLYRIKDLKANLKVKHKGIIILPAYFEGRFTDNYKRLFQRISDKYNYPIVYADRSGVLDVDVVITHGIPHATRKDFDLGTITYPKEVKMVGYMRDLWFKPEDKEAFEAFSYFANRYDAILHFADDFFNTFFGDFKDKAYYFPQFIEKERYAKLPFWEKPWNDQCVVFGSVNDTYPIRKYFTENASRFMHKNETDRIVQYFTPIESTTAPIKLNYALSLNQFKAGFTCGSKFNIATAKHCEIPAAGCLLLCNRTKDLDKMGFKAGVHYKSFVEDDIFDVVREALREDDVEMRRRGREFVLENHTDDQRFEQFCEILDNL